MVFLIPFIICFSFNPVILAAKTNRKMQDQEKVVTEISETDKLAQYMSDFMDWAVAFAPKLGMAVIILMIGFWLIKKISKINRGTTGSCWNYRF